MSIFDQTVKNLVRNRVHDISDRVMDINIKHGRSLEMLLTDGCISVNEEMTGLELRALLPPRAAPQQALDDLEEMIIKLNAGINAGGAA